MTAVRIVLPYHLRNLARIAGDEITVHVDRSNPAEVSISAVLDALEASCPMLEGTIRDHVTKQRRPFLRFFACERDLSHDSPDDPLPEQVTSGREQLLIVGAIAGGSGPAAVEAKR